MDLNGPHRRQLQRNRRDSDGRSQAQTNHQSASSAAQGQACQRCRQQKLRCLRESPKCTRCQRAAALCIYPPPPDRKLLAAQRVRKSRFRPNPEPRSPAAPSDHDNLPNAHSSSAPRRSSPSIVDVSSDLNDTFVAQNADYGQHRRAWAAPASFPPLHVAATADLRPTPAPSPEVARLLIEMYFTRAYNAALLFHRETFLSDYAANKLPSFITHAVFALASIFLPIPLRDSHIEDHETELGISALSTLDFREHAQEWAIFANRQVLTQAIEPNLETIQACQVLALYWFSKDCKDRAHILTHLAYTSCRLLGFHVPNAEVGDGDELSAELRRRCLWSCWMTACISQENASFMNDSWTEVVGLPFPTDETSFAAGKPESSEAFDEFGKVISYNGSRNNRHNSMMGELVKLLSLWWQTQRFVRRYQDGYPNSTNASDRMQEFLKLDRRLEMISERFHPDMKYSGTSSFVSPKIDPYIIFSFQSLYCLCACVLHSSFVPLFSSTPADPEISKKLVRMCAEQAVKHSVITLDMATAFLRSRPDKSRLSSMTGFAMYVTSMIQIRSLSAQGKLKTHTGHLKAAVSILTELNRYWAPLRPLLAKLSLVSSFAGLDINNLVINRNDQQMNPAEIQTDIEQIVSPEAVSESGPGADLYTYVERKEPRVNSQYSSPANITPQNAAEHTINSPEARHDSISESQISQERGESICNVSSRLDVPGRTVTMPGASSFPPAYAQGSDNLPLKKSHHGGFDQHLSTRAGSIQRTAEVVQLQMAGSNPTVQLYGAPMILQSTSLEQAGGFRPMIDGFGTTNGMMGISMDLNNDDDDFWWTRSWGSAKIV